MYAKMKAFYVLLVALSLVLAAGAAWADALASVPRFQPVIIDATFLIPCLRS